MRVSMLHLATLATTALLVAGCASETKRADSSPATSEAAASKAAPNSVAQRRAIERWDLLIAHKAEKAYDYLSPGYRATKDREAYANEMNNRPVEWKKVLPYREVCDKPDVCVIDMQVDIAVKMQGVSQSVSSVGFVTETWIRTHGKWYFLPNATDLNGRK